MIQIGQLYNDLLSQGYKVQLRKKDYEVIEPKNVQILTNDNKYVKLVALSRHKTNKHLIKVYIKTEKSGDHDITITTDHVCMIYNRDHFFDNVNAKNLEVGDYVKVYDENSDSEVVGIISRIEDLGNTEGYVYDCEVDDDLHSFYCNDVLVHNSQFIRIADITNEFRVKYDLQEKMIQWEDQYKLELWKYMSDFVNNNLNKFVQKIMKEWTHTEHPEVLTYSLEYIGETGLYESKKHYGVAKILSEGPEIVNKIKYSGIELKKASVPIKVKEYLRDIYSNTLTNDWKEKDYMEYLNKIYPEFEHLSMDEIAIWKGYNTSRESTGFLQMEKGATGISKAVTFYNQLIEKLSIGDKYDAILLGDKVRFCYVKPTNRYGINVIAYKDGQYPSEFEEMFDIDYETMWEKLIESPLKNFLVATHWRNHNPNSANLMSVDDL